MPARNDPRRAGHGEAWYQQPVLWFGVAVFAALLAGCIWIIAASMHHADIPLDTSRGVLGVPAAAGTAHKLPA